MLFALAAITAQAADHGEAPSAAADPAADINDLYAWVDEEGNTNLLMTVQPFYSGPSSDAYDADVLYQFHFRDPIAGTDLGSVDVRFGTDAMGNWGVQADYQGIATVSGPVDHVNEVPDVKLFAGITDDPFFFDLQGFQDTLATGTIAFDPTRDAFAGANVLTIAVQGPSLLAAADVWATTSRITAAPL